jgi:outer membrane receptor protein involved in Fe transport
VGVIVNISGTSIYGKFPGFQIVFSTISAFSAQDDQTVNAKLMVPWATEQAQHHLMKKALLLLFLLPTALFSQTVTGRVIDKNTREPIPSPQVSASGGQQLTGTIDGEFTLAATGFPFSIIVRAQEYLSDTLEVSAPGEIVVELEPDPGIVQEIGPVVVAASRRAQAIEDVPVSIEILKPELIANKGITDLEQAVDQVPGAYAMDGQVSIRGGSGFSYGAGSRVLILWNEVPLLSADAGDAKWNSIPMENAQQVEVIKGASSVLYGSGALNGIISLIEREPVEKPYLSAKVQSGVYDNPRRGTLRWWDKGKNPFQHQADVSYGKQLGRGFGLTLGGYAFTSDGYRQGETEDRGRFNGTVYYRPAKIGKLRASLGWNFQYQKAGNFIIWQSDTFAYQPYGGADTSLAESTLTYNRGLRLTIDPSVKYFDRFGNKHQLKTRYYLTDNMNYSNRGQSSQSQVRFADYQFQRGWKDNSVVLTTGASVNSSAVDSYLYGDHNSLNTAVYAQGEKKWKKLDVTAGVRFEYFKQDTIRGDSDTYLGKDSLKIPVKPILRAGVHYEIAKHTHVRASFGQGVRYPSVAERFTTTSVGSLLIFPNPGLKPETGWAAEVGVKQGIRIGEWKGFADAAAFINNYDNMTEFTFGNYRPDSIPASLNPNDPGYVFKWLGFRAENAESAQISGLDFSISGEGKIGAVNIQTLMGYTYMNPVTRNRDSAYLATFSDSSSTMLKYRFRHMAKFDLQATWKGFSLGASMRMNSFMTNIDATFEDGVLGQQILPGLKEYRREHNGMTFVFDARIAWEYKERYRVGFIVNNVLNAEYMSRPGDIQPPRTFILQLQYRI